MDQSVKHFPKKDILECPKKDIFSKKEFPKKDILDIFPKKIFWIFPDGSSSFHPLHAISTLIVLRWQFLPLLFPLPQGGF